MIHLLKIFSLFGIINKKISPNLGKVVWGTCRKTCIAKINFSPVRSESPKLSRASQIGQSISSSMKLKQILRSSHHPLPYFGLDKTVRYLHLALSSDYSIKPLKHLAALLYGNMSDYT